MGYYINNKTEKFLKKNPFKHISLEFIRENFAQIVASWDFLNFKLSRQNEIEILFSEYDVSFKNEELATVDFVFGVNRITSQADIINHYFGNEVTDKFIQNQSVFLKSKMVDYHDLFYDGRELEYSLFDLLNKEVIVLWNSSNRNFQMDFLECLVRLSNESYVKENIKSILFTEVNFQKLLENSDVLTYFVNSFFENSKKDFLKIRKMQKE